MVPSRPVTRGVSREFSTRPAYAPRASPQANRQGPMQRFDPRRLPVRLAPAVLGGAAVVLAATIGVLGSSMLDRHFLTAHRPTPKGVDIKAIENQAFAEAPTRPGMSAPETMPVKVLPGETLEAAVQRTGIAPAEAHDVVRVLAQAFDTVNIKAGLAFQAAIAKPRGRRGPAQLIGLSMRTGPASAVTLSRTFDGALHLRELEEEVTEETTVAQGHIDGSLYESAVAAGADSRLTAEVVKLFSKKLDFARDLHPNDEFRLVFDRKFTESGRTVETGDLLYAEIGAKGQVSRFYRFVHDGKAQYFDELGKNIQGFLLRTPVDAVRITSGFGARLHPVLGYTRMHKGIDFGAPKGTPVFAAGDGVVEQKGWSSGYGNWLKIRHSGDWHTGYGHLSGYASSLKVGQHVSQGQLVAYVGMTGLATGPHLHYEVFKGKGQINPKGAQVPSGTVLAGQELAAFKTDKAEVDTMIAKAAAKPGAPQMAKLELRPRMGVIKARADR